MDCSAQQCTHSESQTPKNTLWDTCCPNKRREAEESPSSIKAVCCSLLIRRGGMNRLLCFSGPWTLVFCMTIFSLNCNEITPLIMLCFLGPAVRERFRGATDPLSWSRCRETPVKLTRIIKKGQLIWACLSACQVLILKLYLFQSILINATT